MPSYQEYGRAPLKSAEAVDAPAGARAAALWEKVVVLDDSLSEPHYLLGDLALRNGRTERTAQQLEPATKLHSQGSKEHLALSRAYRRLEWKECAARELSFSRS